MASAPRRARSRRRRRSTSRVRFAVSSACGHAGGRLQRGRSSRSRTQRHRYQQPFSSNTSYVVEALIVSQPLHSAAVNVLVRLATEDVRIRFSSMLELELAETAFQIALKENHPKDWKRFRHDGRARRRASRLMIGVDEAWTSVLAYLDYVRIDVDQVIEEVPRLMRAYGLASYDAVHAATALRTDPVAIVTTDVGFSALPAANTTIFTDASRVARCRELRARRR